MILDGLCLNGRSRVSEIIYFTADDVVNRDFSLTQKVLQIPDGGMKFDKGKLLANIPFEDFPLALRELIRVCTFGAKKYARSSWKTVPNAETRYGDARARHFIDASAGIDLDEESELDHLAHEAWNCLALLQLKLEKKIV